MGLEDVFNSKSLPCISDSEEYYGLHEFNYVASALGLHYAGHT